MPDAVFIEEMQNPVTRRGEPVEITSPPSQVAYWGRLLAMLATLTTHPLVAFSVAGVLFLIFGILGGASVAYGQLLALTSHAMLIPALGTLISTVLRLTTDLPFEGSLFQALTDGGEFGGVWGVLARLDPFMLWAAIVIGVGLHAMDPRRSRVGAAMIAIGLYVLLVMAGVMLGMGT